MTTEEVQESTEAKDEKKKKAKTIDILKEYEGVIFSGQDVIDKKSRVISVGPKLDISLGGGVPEGSVFLLNGPEKTGKSMIALTFAANAQALDKFIVFNNIEGNRLKSRDIMGIRGLDVAKEKMAAVRSVEGKILTGVDYLKISEFYLKTKPGCVCIFDSLSALSSEAEMTAALDDTTQLMDIQKTQAKFCRRIANILPVTQCTIVGITHQMANIGFGHKTKTEKVATSWKYQTDVKLELTYAQPIMAKGNQIGQTAFIKIHTSAIGPPGAKVECKLKYGLGIWKEMELVDLMVDFGLAKKAQNGWYTLPEGSKVHGDVEAALLLEEHPDLYAAFYKEIRNMLSLPEEV